MFPETPCCITHKMSLLSFCDPLLQRDKHEIQHWFTAHAAPIDLSQNIKIVIRDPDDDLYILLKSLCNTRRKFKLAFRTNVFLSTTLTDLSWDGDNIYAVAKSYDYSTNVQGISF